MIAYLTGELLEVGENSVTVVVGGVGYRVEVHPSGLHLMPETGREVRLHIYTCVREDAITLFGFNSAEARSFFETLLGVSGVGPRVAQSLIASSTLGRLKAAIAAGEVAALVKVPGVGRKTAERIVVDLKDKVKDALLSSDFEEGPGSGDAAGEAVAVLVELGYSRQRAAEAVQKVGEADRENGVEAIIRTALRYLGSD